jgi:hypothetical protein
VRLATAERTEMVKGYLADFPDLPSLTLARILYKTHPKNFKTVESARGAIRYHRGQSGKANRKKLVDTTHIKEHGEYSPFDAIPEGMTSLDDVAPIEIEGEKILRLCDAHIPYHDKTALITALKWGQREKVDTIIMDDFIDFFALSFWEKDPDERDFNNELETLYRIFGIIRELFPDARLILKKGNHEARFDRYMRVKAPELLGVKHFEFNNVIHADDVDMEVMDDKAILKVADLHIIHGHEFRRSFFSPVNPARGLWLRAKAHCIAGHHHQTSEHKEKTIGDKVNGCWSIGCLCELKPDYMPINNWNHGSAIIYRPNTKNFIVRNKTIINGELY